MPPAFEQHHGSSLPGATYAHHKKPMPVQGTVMVVQLQCMIKHTCINGRACSHTYIYTTNVQHCDTDITSYCRVLIDIVLEWMLLGRQIVGAQYLEDGCLPVYNHYVLAFRLVWLRELHESAW